MILGCWMPHPLAGATLLALFISTVIDVNIALLIFVQIPTFLAEKGMRPVLFRSILCC